MYNLVQVISTFTTSGFFYFTLTWIDGLVIHSGDFWATSVGQINRNYGFNKNLKLKLFNPKVVTEFKGIFNFVISTHLPRLLQRQGSSALRRVKSPNTGRVKQRDLIWCAYRGHTEVPGCLRDGNLMQKWAHSNAWLLQLSHSKKTPGSNPSWGLSVWILHVLLGLRLFPLSRDVHFRLIDDCK